MRIASAALLLGMLGIGGCGFVSPDLPQQSELDAARARWESLGIDSYEYRFENSCMCPPESTGPIIITVTGGEVADIRRPDDAAGLPPPDGRVTPTIPELFDAVQSAIDEGADSISVQYDEEAGFPTQLYIDWDAGVADEETSYLARDLDMP